MLESGFVSKVMELFKVYPFNNILHLHVRDILGELIAGMAQRSVPNSPASPASPADSSAAVAGNNTPQGVPPAPDADSKASEQATENVDKQDETGQKEKDHEREGEDGDAGAQEGAEGTELGHRIQPPEVAAQIQEYLFDKVDLLNWLMDMDESADNTHYKVRLRITNQFQHVCPTQKTGCA